MSSLLEHGLIDELNIFVNPVAIGRGMAIFKDRRKLQLTQSTVYPSGIVVNTNEPGDNQEISGRLYPSAEGLP